VSLFVLSPEIEDRDEVEIANGRSIKRLSALNDIMYIVYYFFSNSVTKSNHCDMSI
jgi:hypothetical protein